MPETEVSHENLGVEPTVAKLYKEFKLVRDGGSVEDAMSKVEDISLQLESGVFKGPEDFYGSLSAGFKMEPALAEVAISRAVAVSVGPEGDIHKERILKEMMSRLNELCVSQFGSESKNPGEQMYRSITTSYRNLDLRTLNFGYAPTESKYGNKSYEYHEDVDELPTNLPNLEQITAHRLMMGISKLLSGKESLDDLRDQSDSLLQLSNVNYNEFPEAANLIKLIGDTSKTEGQAPQRWVRVRVKYPSLYNAVRSMPRIIRNLPGVKTTLDAVCQATTEPSDDEIKLQESRNRIELGFKK